MRGSRAPRIAIQAAEVRPAGEAFGVGVEEHDGECHGREQQGEAVELGGREEEERGAEEREPADEAAGEQTGGDSSGGGAGVGGVEGGVGPAIEGHAGGARENHADDDPEELHGVRPAGGGEHGTGEGEGEGKDAVLPLDHLEGGAGFMPERHHSQ